MKLTAEFDQELTKQSSGAPAKVVVDAGPRRMVCEMVESNSLAVSLVRLRLTTTELAGASIAELQRISQSLADKLTYLMEPISPVEIDAAACIVQLRSNPPQKDDDGRSYYELLVRRGGEISLTRYRKDHASARHETPATVTREVLRRLVADFVAALDERS